MSEYLADGGEQPMDSAYIMDAQAGPWVVFFSLSLQKCYQAYFPCFPSQPQGQVTPRGDPSVIS